jgi:predicted DNA-binding transcriptional regulator AlpA
VHTTTINPARLAAAEKKAQPPALLNEGQACALIGIGRRKFHDVRQQPWFIERCTAIELGPRALRWHRDELLAAMQNAPRRVVQAEPAVLVAARSKAVAA